ncbi:Uncharacterised protein [Rodentibacter pneumotropicus]|uniref:Uncharacterized protein n=1 Tax=Rodentibacter pneumotropicus TaxID=758 RepID=A0A3S4VD25_9PAST|nr:Uncharacterised protein [Rodentibacter pneumotropicus]
MNIELLNMIAYAFALYSLFIIGVNKMAIKIEGLKELERNIKRYVKDTQKP